MQFLSERYSSQTLRAAIEQKLKQEQEALEYDLEYRRNRKKLKEKN